MSEPTLNSTVANYASGAKRKKRAVLYLRVSTPGQVHTDYDPEGISIPAQREAGKRKAELLDADIVNEFVEPGRSATSIDKRPAFQEMIAWVKAQGNIDYVIVYHFNRVFRNAVDAGIVKRDLKKVGTRIVSTIIDMGDGPESDLIETILHAVDQYQSQASGADIKYKMGQKVKNGGTVSQARLGYLNVREAKPEGGEIRTIAIDEHRAPFVKLAFELYATNDWTQADIVQELYDRGLRTRATPQRPAQGVTISKMSLMLRDRYYLGYVTHDGQEYKGRHEALITPELFDRVQVILTSRTAAQERRRVHHHYLKGSLFCGRCHRAGRRGRLIIQRAVNRRGSEYMYFFCRNKQNGTCDSRYVNILHVEQAVEEYYAVLQFSPEFVTEVRKQLDTTLAEENAATRLLHQQLTTELHALDAKENNLLDLGFGDLTASAKAKIKAKLQEIEVQRERLTERLGQTKDDLTYSAELIETCLTLLENPQALYLRCDDEQRRMLNQALFTSLYLEDDHVTDSDMISPFSQLHALQDASQAAKHNQDSTDHQDADRAAPREGNGPSVSYNLEDLLRGVALAPCSSKPSVVELRGIEPLTFSMRTRRATNCATAPSYFHLGGGTGKSIAGPEGCSAHPLLDHPAARR
jgi:site-specific DNA recombinase